MIRLKKIRKTYHTKIGTKVVLDDVHFDINPGEKIGILGRNGAGKSTIIRLISGAELPTSGTIERKMSISWPLAFGGAFQGSLTGMDNIKFIARVYNSPIKEAIDYVNDFSELGKNLLEPVKRYSSGMRARLAFGISMAIDFDCYLIDEIIAVGDQRFQDKCHEELFVKRADKAMLMVSHNADFIRAHCTKIGVLVNGTMHSFENTEEGINFYHSNS